MSKLKANIGTVTDPHTGEIVPVRRNAAGALYYLSPHGCVQLRRESDYLEKNAVLWPDGEPPPGCPGWIAAGLGKAPAAPMPAEKAPAAPIPAEKTPASNEAPAAPEANNDFSLW